MQCLPLSAGLHRDKSLLLLPANGGAPLTQWNRPVFLVQNISGCIYPWLGPIAGISFLSTTLDPDSSKHVWIVSRQGCWWKKLKPQTFGSRSRISNASKSRSGISVQPGLKTGALCKIWIGFQASDFRYHQRGRLRHIIVTHPWTVIPWYHFSGWV